MMRQARLFVLVWLVTGCATLSEQAPVSVPAVFHPYFGECSPADGAATLSFFRDGAIVGSGDAEWVAKKGSFTLEMLDPVGRTVLRVQRRAGRLASTGPLASRIPSLAIRKDGFLDVDGHMLPIRATELPCVFAGYLPRSWLGAARRVEGARVTVADKTRTIEIGFDKPEDRRRGRICSSITWGGFAWYRHELSWCQQGEGRRESVVDGDGGFALRIVKLQEEGT